MKNKLFFYSGLRKIFGGFLMSRFISAIWEVGCSLGTTSEIKARTLGRGIHRRKARKDEMRALGLKQ